MKKLLTLTLLTVFALPLFATDWKNAPVVDVQCSSRVKANPDAHTKDCANKCARSGFGIYSSDGQFLKFDSKGNKEFLNELQKTDKKDHLRVNVTGQQSGDTIKVKSVSLS
jgi:hypothetical protein